MEKKSIDESRLKAAPISAELRRRTLFERQEGLNKFKSANSETQNIVIDNVSSTLPDLAAFLKKVKNGDTSIDQSVVPATGGGKSHRKKKKKSKAKRSKSRSKSRSRSRSRGKK